MSILALVADVAGSRSDRPGGDRAAGGAGRHRQPRHAAALARRRHRRGGLARRPASRFWKIPTPISRRSPSTASSSGSAIWRRSASPCWRAPICRWRPARRCSPSCRTRSPASSPGGNGSAPNTPKTPRERPARRRPSRSPPTRLTTRSANWCSICAQSGQLTAGMILRALLSGNVVLFEEALAELSDVPIDRVTSYIHDRNISGFSALYRKAGLPDQAYPAFREAIAAMREGVLVGERGGAGQLKRRMVERVLRCLRGRARPRFDVAAGAAAAVCGRGRARGSAHVLRRSGRQRPCDRPEPAHRRRALGGVRRNVATGIVPAERHSALLN